MNMINKLIVLTLITGLFTSMSLLASENRSGVLIVGSNVKAQNLSAKDVRNIFLGKTTLWDDNKRINIGLCTDNKEDVNNFFTKYLRTSERRYKKYWLKQVFSGNGVAPKIFKNINEAIEYTINNDNAIVFVSQKDKAVPSEVKIISVDGKSSL